ncbi:MAG: hypothetical protein KBA61_03420 [Spirochaetes bacterium]|nr:hypothetical protein [Spirochaetota bacterium]
MKIDYDPHELARLHGGEVIGSAPILMWRHNGNVFNRVGYCDGIKKTVDQYIQDLKGGSAKAKKRRDHSAPTTPKPAKQEPAVKHEIPDETDLLPANISTGGLNKIDTVKAILTQSLKFRYNIITGKYEFTKKDDDRYIEFTDRVFNSIRSRINSTYLTNLTEDILRMVIESDFTPEYCPIAEYFSTLPPWDGEDHIKRLADTVQVKSGQFGKVENWDGKEEDRPDIDATDVFRLYLTRWLVASVATMLQRYENHTCLTFIGPQGLGKTTWQRRLGIYEDLVFVGAINPADKDSKLQYAEKVLIVLDELETTTKHELGGIKSNMTLKHINVRRPYGRRTEKLPRRASFCASANDEHILADLTGSRRWLCVIVEKVDYLAVTPELMRNVYSQALHLLDSGVKYWFEGEDISLLEKRNQRFYAPCPEEEALFKIVYHPEAKDLPASSVSEIFTNTDLITRMSTAFPGIKFSSKKLGQVLNKYQFPRKCRANDHLQGYEVSIIVR